MPKKYVMPERREQDGPVGVGSPDKDSISITVTKDGQIQTIEMSRYNAWRIFGLLSLMLKLPVTKAVGKAIKLGGDGLDVTYVPETTLKTFGERVAWHLHMQELKRLKGAK